MGGQGRKIRETIDYIIATLLTDTIILDVHCSSKENFELSIFSMNRSCQSSSVAQKRKAQIFVMSLKSSLNYSDINVSVCLFI